MTTLVVAGAQATGQALVKTAGAVALSYANSAISRVFDNRVLEGPRLSNFQLMTSRDGAPMVRSYGRVRLSGQVIWASRLKETVTKEKQGKGGPSTQNYSYTISFAIGLCEGVMQSVDRFWVNGQNLQTSGLTYRVYKGTDDQMPDPIISAIDGDVPAFRGTAYVVFEDFPLDDFGERLPQINAEVTRLPPPTDNSAARLENLVTGVHLLPSSGEFAYASEIIEDVSQPGAARPINMNNISGQSDILQALDQLETDLPNCQNVSLVISWFGDDLRAGHCKIRPGVESSMRNIEGQDWTVAGLNRQQGYVISKDDEGRPIYGGTPSDSSILEAIKTLKARGYKVTIYPFILMDVPAANDLPDPYGGAGQSAFPWRGRITVHPAAGQENTADQTPDAAAQIDGFYGNGQDDGLKRFILHYADLAVQAGGVDRFVISSELIGLTTARSSRTHYPFVEKLQNLASEVKARLPLAALSYAADWSEYFGHHPQDGSNDLTFHLDPLWADSAIDGIGIDAYFPLSDWRDGDQLDGELAATIYDLEYLKANLRGGEGYDYYYASPEDRITQTRSPITDHAYNKPWVFRYKDLFNWWINPHINRLGGQETEQSPWVPRSKPFWLTEVGCPAIDKGANQPNVFFDPKSSESKTPYFSAGSRDDLIQRRYLEAFLSYFTPENNPVSAVYGAPMVDMSAAFVWCWDARPYPDFPARQDVWSDGLNWELGHWLTGRTGLALVSDVVHDLVLRAGVNAVDVSDIRGVLEGFVLDRPMSTRAALSPLALAYGFDMAERANGLAFISQGGPADINLTWHDIAAPPDNSAPVTQVKDDPEGRLRDVRLYFIDGTRDHQMASIFARELQAETVNVLDVQLPIVMDAGYARVTAERLLNVSTRLDQTVEFLLSPMRVDAEVGDRITLPETAGVWQVTRIDSPGSSGGAGRVSAKASGEIRGEMPYAASATPIALPPVAWAPKPDVIALDIADFSGAGRDGIFVGARVIPFNPVTITAPDTAVDVNQTALIGEVLTPFATGPLGRLDFGNVIDFFMRGADFDALEKNAFLAGGNKFAIQTPSGWEIIQAQSIELTAPDTYRATKLLRGLHGSDTEMDVVRAGAKIVNLNQGVVNMMVLRERGEDLVLEARSAGRLSDPYTISYEARHLRPLSPVHIKVNVEDETMHLNWIRRTRISGDSWSGLDVPLGEDNLRFRVESLRGGLVIESVDVDSTRALLSNIDVDTVRISQASTVYGFGSWSEIEVPPPS